MYSVYHMQEDGRIVAVAFGECFSASAEGLPHLQLEWVPEDTSTFYVNGGNLTARPTIQEFVGSTLDLTVLPVGSTVRVENESGDFVEATPDDLMIELIDAGVYLVKVVPPFPYKELKQTLVVA